ncbi:GNAT family N-acetyltransferase [Grimontia hollisae]|uniref:GNAT family N-acetyltransferase n=1 Tax=Grimontia hollisae TaxID=673 RepID=UPI001303E5E3|nr:GNAT family N-acetyltransferase [Grimontia hollisae]
MHNYRIAPLDPQRFPLVMRFYKTHYPAGKPKKDEVIWTIEGSLGIKGAVRFRQFGDFQLLTGMLIDPALRRQSIGASLLIAVEQQIKVKTCYCLAYSHLKTMYEKVGFATIAVSELPEDLHGRYLSYCNSGKNLIPMIHNPGSR